jgi:hypothetical protein
VIIALLALLGVNLLVLVGLLAVVLSRKRWVTHQAGVFRGVARSVTGEAHGFHSKWRRGYGRWVHGVLVWTKGPFFFWNELLPVDRWEDERAAAPGEVKRLGDQATVVLLGSGEATVEVAARGEDRDLLVGPNRGSADLDE